MPLTLTHIIEDFDAGVHEDFGPALLPAAFLLSLGFTGQLLRGIHSARGRRLGHLLNLGIASVWIVGASPTTSTMCCSPRTTGAGSSKVLELGAMAIAAAWVAVSLPALGMQKAEDGRDR